MGDLLVDLERQLLVLWLALRFGLNLLRARLWSHERPAVLFRQTLQDFGVTGLKLGQFLALRSDILPPHVCRELDNLFENVAPVPFDLVRTVIETDLGEPIENLFSEFDPVSFAAASIAQVHIARNRDGERVAVKVQRLGLERQFNADMRNLTRLAAVFDAFGAMGKIPLRDMLDEFATYTRREMDFVLEAQTADRLRTAGVCGEIVPRIYWALTSRRVLTMEFIDGVSLAKAISLIDAGNEGELYRLLPGLNIRESLHNLLFASVHQLCITGFFHADPHPGNVLFCQGNRVAFLDFGIFGEVSPMQRDALAGYIEEAVQGNLERALSYYVRFFTPTEQSDMRGFQREAKERIRRWIEIENSPNRPSSERTFAKFSDETFPSARRHNVLVSNDLLLFWRAMIVLDSTIFRLCPDFDIFGDIRTFFGEFRPGLVDRAIEIATPETHLSTLVQLATTSAKRLGDILSAVAAGKFELNVMTKESPEARRMENRRTRLIVLALLGTSVLLLTRLPAPPALRIAIAGIATLCFVFSLTGAAR
jgi:ubiquinone biosynthesis protein